MSYDEFKTCYPPKEDWSQQYIDATADDPVVQSNVRLMIKGGISEALIKKIVDRHTQGMLDYGTSMEDNPLSVVEWIDHAIEELLDGANYLQKIKTEMIKVNKHCQEVLTLTKE